MYPFGTATINGGGTATINGGALPQLMGGGTATLVVLLFKNFSVFAYIAEGFFFTFVFKHNKESL